MKTTLHTEPVNNGPFNCRPAMPFELDDERILCNDVHLPHNRCNYYNTRLWVIWNEFGPVCAVWADNEQEALDEMVNLDMGGSFLVDEETVKEASEEERDEWAQLGNAGEYCDLTYCGLAPVCFEPSRDWQIMCRFAEARGSGAKTLADV